MTCKKLISKDELFNLYYNQNLSCLAISKIKKCSSATISKYFNLYGFKKRSKAKDFTGEEIYDYTVIKLDRVVDGRHYWECQCKCGKISVIDATDLYKKKRKGCLECSGKKRRMSEDILSDTKWKHILGHRFRKTKILDIGISKEEAYDLFLKQNKKCAISGVEIKFINYHKTSNETTASLDRIDSNKGYIKGNIQWVHKTINNMKQALSDEEFIKWCRKVVDNQGTKT